MLTTFFSNIDIYSWEIISILILTGFLVGIINTLAGNGTAITFYLFLLLGLPPSIANGTVRLGVIMQTLTASLNYRKHKVLDWQKGLKLGAFTVVGSVIGAMIAVKINEDIFEIVIGVVMLIMLFFIFYKPESWIKGRADKTKEKPTIVQFLIFFIIGIYGGFLHIGTGVFLLSALVLFAGYDLVKANALKVFIVLLYSPFSLFIFILNDQVFFYLGFIVAIGNMIGGYIASKFAIKWGAKFIRWILITVIILFVIDLFLI